MTELEIFEIVLCLRDQQVFVLGSLEILNVFNTLKLKQVFCKTKTFNCNNVFYLKKLQLKTQHVDKKLKQIQLGV